jgi:wobble nucleotide-excising tRNase
MGVYADFSWATGFPEFKDYNVIYGWNGTGKTTLSKLLGTLNTGSHPDFPSLEYTVQDSDASTHIPTGRHFPTSVRVF